MGKSNLEGNNGSGKQETRLGGLFENAIHSIKFGIEDFQNDDSARAISAIRNFYAGILLLAKEVLVRKAPVADPKNVIGVRFNPVPDGSGGVKYESSGHRTIDFNDIPKRFKDFKLAIDGSALSALKDLNRIRNNIEHYYSEKPHDAMREAIAKAFTVVTQLFRALDLEPSESLGDSWEVMLNENIVYQQEIDNCWKSFEKVQWRSAALADVKFRCPHCESDLIEQVDPENGSQDDLRCRCRQCGSEDIPEEAIDQAIEEALQTHFEHDIYIAKTDGIEPPVHTCPECGRETYLLTEYENLCVLCELVLGECRCCGNSLTPTSASFEDPELCSYCVYKLSRDD